MRPGQNNKRMRGRNNNNNRKSPNPLTRSYESNGPDVKIRGTAHHVAEKYLQLARDAQSSGDPVMAESYLQHAEHYFRLIAAAQAAQQQAQMGYQRSPNDPILEDEDEDDDFSALPDRFASPPERLAPPPPYANPQQPMMQPPAPQQQPYQDRAPYNGERPQQQDRQQQPRGDRPNGDRPYQDRNNQNRFNQNRGPRDNRPPREFRNDGQPQPQYQPQQQPQPQAQPQPRVELAPEPEPVGLPSFITTPVRVQAPVEATPAPVVEQARDEQPTGGYHLRPRRRRARPDAERAAGESEAPEQAPAPGETSLFGE